jgi:hypothetical protein
MRWLVLALFLSGCVPGCGGESAEGEGPSGPVRLPPGMGGAESEGEGATEGAPVEIPPPSSEELADPPPVEPPPP